MGCFPERPSSKYRPLNNDNLPLFHKPSGSPSKYSDLISVNINDSHFSQKHQSRNQGIPPKNSRSSNIFNDIKRTSHI